MSSELDEMREQVIHILDAFRFLTPEDAGIVRVREHFVEAILKAQTDSCRIAVVRKEGDLSRNPYPTLELGSSRRKTEGEVQEEEAARIAYSEAQHDMLSAGYVQEVKDD